MKAQTILRMRLFVSPLFVGGAISSTAAWMAAFVWFAGLSLVSVRADTPARTFKLKAESPKFWKLIPHDARLTRVAGGFGFTEGPVWDESGFLYVSDEDQNKIYRVFVDGYKED